MEKTNLGFYRKLTVLSESIKRIIPMIQLYYEMNFDKLFGPQNCGHQFHFAAVIFNLAIKILKDSIGFRKR